MSNDSVSTPPPPPTAGFAAPRPVAAAGQRSVMSLPAGVTAVSPWARLGAYVLEVLLMIFTLWVGWLIWAAMIAGTGQTPAKRLLGHRVIGAETLRPVGFGKMFWVRWLLAGIVAGFAITFTLGILLFMPFWDRRNQNLWDKVSNTYVVCDPDDVWQTKPSLA